MTALRRLLERARVAREDRDQGMTLAEMVVTMAVGSALLACVTSLMVAQIRHVDGLEKRNTATTLATNAMDLMTKQLRTSVPVTAASPFLSVKAEELGFYANLNSLGTTEAAKKAAFVPQEVWFWVRTVGGKRQLCNQVRAIPAGGGASNLLTEANRTCHVLVDQLATADSTPVFAYLGANDVVGANGLATSTVAMVNGVVTDPTTIRSVQIRLRVKAGTARDDNVVTNTTRVTLTNLTGVSS